ncbi:hypothetical protein [Bacillus infantis]|uniref:hypothetical protein n=1 Tax=Bacillus infantis TaxID=324767 RepID=UPI003CEEB920
MYKHAILHKSLDDPDQWLLNLGEGGWMEITAGVDFIFALDEVSGMGWEAVSVFGEGEDQKALVVMEYDEYKRT